MIENQPPIISAFLIGANLNNSLNIDYSLAELKNLATACNYEVRGQTIQNISKITANFYIGSGKVEEIKQHLDMFEIDVAIFNDELTSMQLRNLEQVLNVRVIDRTMLILEIFKTRAKTKEAMIQVEIARLKYYLPRLVGRSDNLDQQRGGSGINRGKGETRLELDRRQIEKRISYLEKEVIKVQTNREIKRKQLEKNEVFTVALVGYTNAGKTTLMNNFLRRSSKEEQLFAKDMLFATLETTKRKFEFKHKIPFILSDTVGFVDKLPHHLIKAFESTLSEIKEVDLILHIIDGQSEYIDEQIRTTLETMERIGIKDIPIINVINKVDEPELIQKTSLEQALKISAKQNLHIEVLIAKIYEYIMQEYEYIELLIPYARSFELAQVYQKYTITNEVKNDEGVFVCGYRKQLKND
ncbi:MAG: GTPase HflX [Mycoplasmatales bacterium]